MNERSETMVKISEDRIVSQWMTMTNNQPPLGFRDILHVLAHPDMIELTKKYLDEAEKVSPLWGK